MTRATTHSPLGAHVRGDGVDFAVFSGIADLVEVAIFDAQGRETRHPLEADDHDVWRGHVAPAGHGTRYGLRVHGPWDPASGRRCNPAKLLLDPYARAISGAVEWNPALAGGDPGDSAPYMPRSLVHDAAFDWGDDAPPGTPLADSIVYELHVKGFTRRHPDVPEPLRGTYAGLAHPAAIGYLQSLGVTAVELLPVHQFVHEARLLDLGLSNYWGYQSIGFFAPHAGYAAGADPVNEFKALVRALHAAGLEVILDVVYNHTAEGNQDGPTLCFRGLDNAAYYRLQDDRSRYVDDTGTGNTFDSHQPQALRLITDSLRYWVREMHVDGFRFDLAATLGRGDRDFDPHGAFLAAVGQDPVLSQVKLIAEPWDTGAGGYELGDFPPGWSEWNGRFRDTVRDFWRGGEGKLADFATRITGSQDLYGRGRRPTASINLVTVHDGFTLADLTAYDGKHNEANGEGNRDGTDDNRSWNCGAEGPTGDPGITALRARQRRNFLATLLLAEGVPLLLAGDELGRSQGGNNNAYCQDNPTSWIDWSAPDAELLAFVRRLCRLRHEHPDLRRRRFLADSDASWLRPDGGPMTGADWAAPYARAGAALLRGEETLFVAANAWWEPLAFALPGEAGWTTVVDTADPSSTATFAPGATLPVAARSLVLLAPDG